MRTVFAFVDLPEKKLYRFRCMNDDQQRSRVKDIILNHQIRFSRPNELNDPIEGKPIFQLGDWSSETYRNEFCEWMWTLQQRHGNSTRPKDVFLGWLRGLSAAEMEPYTKQITDEYQASIEEKWRVLSLSAVADNDLMWSHYADGHKGIALVVDASTGDFGRAFKVNYVPERIPQDLMNDDPDDNLESTILTKRSSWAYEEEYRCIFEEHELANQFLKFKPAHLLGVIFGVKALASDIELVMAWGAARPTPLHHWQARLTSDGSIQVEPRCS